jgi:hypothetical protein
MLREYASAHWRRIAPGLWQTGLLTILDERRLLPGGKARWDVHYAALRRGILASPTSILKSCRFGSEFQLSGIITDHADIALRKTIGCFRLDFQRELNLRALCALKLHHDRVDD